MAADFIASPRNQRVKEVVRLRSRSERDRTGLFLIEGASEVTKALVQGIRGQALYVSGEDATDQSVADAARAAGIEVVEAAESAYRRMAYRDGATGVLLVAEQFDTGLAALDAGKAPLVLVVEAIEKPGNLGTILRTAEGAGVDAVIVCDPATDVFNPNVVRASLGTVFWLPVAVAPSNEAIIWLRQLGTRLIASTPAAVLPHHEADMRGPVALIVGAEHAGLSRIWLDQADDQVHIPMRGRGDSLNAAASAAVLLYEAVRQRHT